MQTENRPLMTVNTHPRLKTEPNASPDIGVVVTSIWKGANERQLQHHARVDSAMDEQGVRKPNRGHAHPQARIPETPLRIRSVSDFTRELVHPDNQVWGKRCGEVR